MAEIPRAVTDFELPKTLSKFLNIRASYFTFPNVIFYIIIPYIAATYFWYVVLNYKVRIFRNKQSINAVLAFFISFFNIAAADVFPPALSVPIFVAFATILVGNRFSKRRVLFAIGLGVFLAFIYPRLMNMFL